MYKVIICPSYYFEAELEKWYEEQDNIFPDHITDFKIISIIKQANNQVAHYIEYNLVECEND